MESPRSYKSLALQLSHGPTELAMVRLLPSGNSIGWMHGHLLTEEREGDRNELITPRSFHVASQCISKQRWGLSPDPNPIGNPETAQPLEKKGMQKDPGLDSSNPLMSPLTGALKAPTSYLPL